MAEKILVTRSSLPPLEEYVDEIRSIFESHWLTNMGEKHEALERELKRFLGVEQICLFQNSGGFRIQDHSSSAVDPCYCAVVSA